MLLTHVSLKYKAQLDLLRDSMIFIELLCICLNVLLYIFGHVWTRLDTICRFWTRLDTRAQNVWTRALGFFLDTFGHARNTHWNSLFFWTRAIKTILDTFGHAG